MNGGTNMKKIRSLLAATLVLCLLVMTLGGCANKSSSTGNTKTAVSKPVVLTMAIQATENMKPLKAVSDAAKKAIGISINFEVLSSDSYVELLKTRFATGDVPDLMQYIAGAQMNYLNPTKNFVDLSKQTFVSQYLDSFKKTVTADNGVYGVPIGASMGGAMLYNKAVYKKLGLSVPKTWKEFLSDCDKIKAAGNIVPVIMSYKDPWTVQVPFLGDFYNVAQADPKFVEEYSAGNRKYANTPAAVRSFEKLASLKPYINSDYISTTYNTALEMLADGKGANYPILGSALPVIAQNYPDKINDIGMFPILGDDPNNEGLTVWYDSIMYLCKASKNIDAGLKWFNYYMSASSIKLYSSIAKPNGPYLIKGQEMPEDTYAAVKEILPYFNSGKTSPACEYLTPVKGGSLPAICYEVLSGSVTPKQGAALFDAECVKKAVQLGLNWK
jgi:raffinose/stachyose/melibiose transport system substrate-binding protein